MRKRLKQELLNKEKGDDPNANPAIYQEAYGAMAEWRTSLFFISRIVFDRKRGRLAVNDEKGNPKYIDPPLVPRLEEPSQSVIDAGWREWMRNKRPTLNHKMLATLSGLLRIDTILTTNFDDFTERAFEQSRNPLQSFDVRLMDGLPERELVARARSIVKMHGSTRSLRADYSLDGEPSVEDKWLFAEYLAGEELKPTKTPAPTHNPDPKSSPPRPLTKKHLFISGVGATEHRTVSFITHALNTLNDLKVFWVCYTEDDVREVVKYARDLPQSDRPHIFVIRHTEIALLLLHIYQSIRKTLPPENALYPAVTQLSIPPLPRLLEDCETTELKKLERIEKIEKFRMKLSESIKNNPLTVATAPDEIDGVTTACEKVFREFESKYVCMWIEMNDIHSIDELFEVIQETAYYKLGQLDWTPLYATDDGRPRNLELERIADSSSKSFLIFINAREQPGSNRVFQPKSENAWLDDMDEQDIHDQLNQLLSELKNSRSGAFKVVLLAHNSESRLVTRIQRFVGNTVILEHDSRDQPAETINTTIGWAQSPADKGTAAAPGRMNPARKKVRKAKLHFLHTLALMQRARHLSICWARCAGQPDPFYWSPLDKSRTKWLDQLERKGLIRRKDGGFVWLHSHLRQELRQVFILRNDLLGCEERAEIQRDIALWYLKQFDSTGTPPAIFEAVDHLCFSAAHSIVGAAVKSKQDPSEENDKQGIRNLCLATKRVHTARELLNEHKWLIHTQGYPRASSRRLEYISDFWLNSQWMTEKINPDTPPTVFELFKIIGRPGTGKAFVNLLDALAKLRSAIAALQQEAAHVGILIAREIGEDRRAYQLLHVFAQRLMGHIDRLDTVIIKELKNRSERSLHLEIQDFLHTEQNKPSLGPQRQSWMSWWFLCGLLGIASRSYEKAEDSLFRALQIAVAPEIPKVQSNCKKRPVKVRWTSLLKNDQLKFDFTPNAFEERTSDLNIVYSQALEVMEQAAHLLLLRATIAQREISLISSDTDSWFNKKPKDNEAWKAYRKRSPEKMEEAAQCIALKGLILIEQLQDSGIDRPDQDHYLMGTKSRLLQIAGLASRYQPERKEWSRHAMSLMGDAAAALNEAQPIFAHAEHAVIDIRRAEIRLHEAATKKLLGRYEFETLTLDRLLGDRIASPTSRFRGKSQFQMVRFLKRIFQRAKKEDDKLITQVAQQLQNDLKEITSRATDAIRFLDRAEPILRDRRRNVFWTTRYFEMRLRAIAMILWASVVQEGKPIPYLGLEAAMRRAETEPDQLLNDAVRMIRVDSYRLAMVILAYASCARALQIRLELDQKAVRLPERLREMANLLDHSVRQLEKVRDRRKNNALTSQDNEKKTQDKRRRRADDREIGKVDNGVDRVVQETITRVRGILIGLR